MKSLCKNIRPFNGKYPLINSSCFVDATAVIIGDVKIDANSSIWPNAVLRGDVNYIQIGHSTSIQDGCVLHVTHKGKFSDGSPLIIGDMVTVGHNATLHACTIGNTVLVGMGSVVLDGAVIQDKCILAAGSVVPPNKTLESGMYIGSPTKKVRDLTQEEINFLEYSAQNYIDLKNKFMSLV